MVLWIWEQYWCIIHPNVVTEVMQLIFVTEHGKMTIAILCTLHSPLSSVYLLSLAMNVTVLCSQIIKGDEGT